MLEKDRLESFSDDCVFFLDTEESKNIAILGDYFVRLNRIVEVFTVISYG